LNQEIYKLDKDIEWAKGSLSTASTAASKDEQEEHGCAKKLMDADVGNPETESEYGFKSAASTDLDEEQLRQKKD